jgi:hypothetical protein
MFVMIDVPPAPSIVRPAAETPSAEEQLAARAQADGWTPPQAAALAKLGVAGMAGKSIATGTPAFDEAYRQGRRAVTVLYFDNALQSGQSRLVAFLTVIDLEKQLAERRGESAPQYADDWLKAAYAELAQAAARGASSAEQIEIGFAALRAQQNKAAK